MAAATPGLASMRVMSRSKPTVSATPVTLALDTTVFRVQPLDTVFRNVKLEA
jgi:hypothetical protein